MPATPWSSMARTSCRMGPKSILALPVARTARAAALRPHRLPKVRRNPEDLRRARLEEPLDESVAAVHFAAGRHHAPDGRRPSRGLGRLPPITDLCSASGRLPHDSGANVLSRIQPRIYGFVGYRSA